MCCAREQITMKRNKEDPFLDMNPLEPLNQDHTEQMSSNVQDMIQTAIHTCLSNEYIPFLKIILLQHQDIIRVSFCSVSPAKIPLLKVALMPSTVLDRLSL